MAVRDIERDARVHAVLRNDGGIRSGRTDSGTETKVMKEKDETENFVPAVRKRDIRKQQVLSLLPMPAPGKDEVLRLRNGS